jgi:hypothetical protein
VTGAGRNLTERHSAMLCHASNLLAVEKPLA